jgi:hypothetical protein
MAQSTYRAGALPSININYRLNDDWSLNFKTEARHELLEGTFDGQSEGINEYVLTDFSLIAARKVGLSGRVSGGYLIRFREGQVIHRAIQQYTYVQNLSGFRLAHRVVADQTFSPSEATEFRFRYRLATEIPLNGESADPKEFYLKISNEYLNSFQESEYDLEVRLVPLLGYTLSDKYKIEIGIDYRVNSFLDQDAQNSFWTSINWYIDL